VGMNVRPGCNWLGTLQGIVDFQEHDHEVLGL
jgi:hypothetical protein